MPVLLQHLLNLLVRNGGLAAHDLPELNLWNPARVGRVEGLEDGKQRRLVRVRPPLARHKSQVLVERDRRLPEQKVKVIPELVQKTRMTCLPCYLVSTDTSPIIALAWTLLYTGVWSQSDLILIDLEPQTAEELLGLSQVQDPVFVIIKQLQEDQEEESLMKVKRT